MKEIRYFEAFDGKQFDNEDECLDYEFTKRVEPLKKMLIFWNGRGQKMNIENSYDIDNAWAIRCTSIDAATFLKEWGDREECRTPYDEIDLEYDVVPLGNFIYFADEWHLVSDIFDYYEQLKDGMENSTEQIEIIQA